MTKIMMIVGTTCRGAILLLVLCSSAASVGGSMNVTVDDNDSRIKYSSGWYESTGYTQLDYGGYHHLSTDPGATATFNFTGTAIYFMAPLWPYAVGAQVSVDSGSPTTIDLKDPNETTDGGSETVSSAVVWGLAGLDKGKHTLVVSFADGESYLVLDALMYTTEDSSTSSSSGAAASGNRSHSSSGHPLSRHTLSIILGTVVGVVGFALLIAIAVLLLLRQRHRRRYPASSESDHEPSIANTGANSESSPSPSGGTNMAEASAAAIVAGRRGTAETLPPAYLHHFSQYVIEPFEEPYRNEDPTLHGDGSSHSTRQTRQMPLNSTGSPVLSLPQIPRPHPSSSPGNRGVFYNHNPGNSPVRMSYGGGGGRRSTVVEYGGGGHEQSTSQLSDVASVSSDSSTVRTNLAGVGSGRRGAGLRTSLGALGRDWT